MQWAIRGTIEEHFGLSLPKVNLFVVVFRTKNTISVDKQNHRWTDPHPLQPQNSTFCQL